MNKPTKPTDKEITALKRQNSKLQEKISHLNLDLKKKDLKIKELQFDLKNQKAKFEQQIIKLKKPQRSSLSDIIIEVDKHLNKESS